MINDQLCSRAVAIQERVLIACQQKKWTILFNLGFHKINYNYKLIDQQLRPHAVTI